MQSVSDENRIDTVQEHSKNFLKVYSSCVERHSDDDHIHLHSAVSTSTTSLR